MNNLMSPEARRALTVGKSRHWHFRCLGQGDLPSAPVYNNEWWFETLTEVPTKGQDRLLALKMAGIKMKGVVIAHEAPKLLTTTQKAEPKLDFKIAPILSDFGWVFGALFQIFFSMALIDPALIAVLEDGTWIEVMTWFEEEIE